MKTSKIFSFCFLVAAVLFIVRVCPENTVYAGDVLVLNDVSTEGQVIYSEIVSVTDDINICKLLSDENVIFDTEPI